MEYLIVDLSMPEPYGKFIWSPSVGHATPFASSIEADAVKALIPDATDVTDIGGNWYVVKK